MSELKPSQTIESVSGYLALLVPLSEWGFRWFDDRLKDARQARHVELKLLSAELLKSDRKPKQGIVYNSKHEQAGVVERDDDRG